VYAHVIWYEISPVTSIFSSGSLYRRVGCKTIRQIVKNSSSGSLISLNMFTRVILSRYAVDELTDLLVSRCHLFLGTCSGCTVCRVSVY